jgi:hypothetical protein
MVGFIPTRKKMLIRQAIATGKPERQILLAYFFVAIALCLSMFRVKNKTSENQVAGRTGRISCQ